MELEEKIKLCRIVGILLLVDGELLDAEVGFMGDLMARLELDSDAQNEVMDRIDESNEVLADAAALSDHAEHLLEALRDASRIDGTIAGPEADLIDMITKVFKDKGAI